MSTSAFKQKNVQRTSTSNGLSPTPNRVAKKDISSHKQGKVKSSPAVEARLRFPTKDGKTGQ